MAAHALSRRGRVWGIVPLLLAIFVLSTSSYGQTATNLLNINFGGGSKVGLSAGGLTTNDVWNVVHGSSFSTTNNLLWANSTTSSVSLTISNIPSDSVIYDQPDEMLRTYISGTAYDFDLGTIPASLSVSNLPASTYSVYFYAFGNSPMYEFEQVTLTVGTNSYGTRYTGGSFDPVYEPLTENEQYVVFTNVVVASGQTLDFSLIGGYGHAVNGLQILDTTPLPNLPPVVISPASGTTIPVTVSMSVTGHPSAVIYYTTNGSDPTTSSTVYSSSFSLSAEATVKAFATETNYAQTAVATAHYPLPQLPYVTFDPGDSSLLPVSLTLSVTNHGDATIYYTLNGTTPTTGSSVYSSAISLTSSNWSYSGNVTPTMTSYTSPSGNTVTYSSEKSGDSGKAWKAFDHGTTSPSYWIASGTNNEWIALEMSIPKVIGRYAITTRSGAEDGPQSWVLQGWDGSQYVTLDTRINDRAWFANERREFVCQTNGLYAKYRLYVYSGYADTGNTTARICIGELELMKASVTVSAFATLGGYYDSIVTVAEYNAPASSLPQIAPVPTLTPATGLYPDPIWVTITSSLSGAGFEYSTDGSTWQTYTNTIPLETATYLYARTVKSGYETSPTVIEYYAFLIPAVLIDPPGRLFTNAVTVSLSNVISGASLSYKLGSASWQSYSSSFVISNTTLLSVAATKSGYIGQTNTTQFDIVSPDLPPVGTLLNLNFGGGSKTGFAAVGQYTNDAWNVVSNSTLSTNVALRWSSGTTSAVSIVVSNLPYTGSSGSSDAMLNSYLSGDSYGYDEDFNFYSIDAGVELHDLPVGRYDVYLYAVSSGYSYESGGFQLTVGTNTTSTKYTSTFSTDDGWPAWQENLQYVVFTNVEVKAGQTLLVKLTPGGSSEYILNGMQLMVVSGGPPQVPPPAASPANGTFTVPTTISFSNYWAGGLVRYSFDGTNWFTNSSVTLLDSETLYVQAIKDGFLASGILTNSYTVNLPTAASPVLIPVPGEYAVTQLLTFTNSLSGSSNRYRFTGGVWVTNDTAVVSSNATVEVQTLKYGYLPSTSTTGSYTLNTNLTVFQGTLLNLNFGGGSKTGFAATGVSSNDLWNVISASALHTSTNLLWADSNAAPVWLTITNLAGSSTIGVDDPMLNSILTGDSVNWETYESIPARIVIGNLPPATYSIYAYGVGSDPSWDHEGFTLKVGTNSYGTKWTDSTSFDLSSDPWGENEQYVRFTNVVVAAGQPLILDLSASAFTHVVNGLQILNENPPNQLPSVTFSPTNGSTVPVTVTMAVTGHGSATIYYTTDGSTPTTNSTVYSGGFSVTNAVTVKAFATEASYQDAAVSSASYILPTAPTPVISPASGTYTNWVTVTITNSLSGATLQYTTNGTSWLTYTGSFVLSQSGYVRAQASKSGYTNSAVATNTYTINLPTAPTPTASPASSTNYDAVSVTLSNTLSGSTIRYTTNNTDWYDYTSSLTFGSNVTLRAKSTATGYADSATLTNTYTFVVTNTVITPPGGVFTNAVSVTLTNGTPGAVISYQIGTNAFFTYTNSFVISNTAHLVTVATRTGFLSDTNSANFGFFDSNRVFGVTLVTNSFVGLEDTSLSITGAVVIDTAALTNELQLTVWVTNGVISIGEVDGITVTNGTSGVTSNLVFHGTVTNLNLAIASLSYLGNADYFGNDRLSFILDDLNASGAGSVTATNSVALQLLPVNDPPSFNFSTDLVTVAESTNAYVISNFLTNISAGPANESTQTVSFVVQTFEPQYFSSVPTIDSSGTLRFTLSTKMGLTTLLTVLAQDNGGTNNGGVDSTWDIPFQITITDVNDPPTITVPDGTQEVGEDSVLALTGVVSVDDPDAGRGSLLLSLVATNGVLQLGSTNDLTFSSGTNGMTTNLVVSGTLESLQIALTHLEYHPNSNYIGSDAITLVINDQGNTGTGGALSATNQIPISILYANHAPSFTLASNVVSLVEGAVSQTYTNFATSISPGPANESTQSLNFIVTVTNTAFFSVQPSLSSTGTFQFTLDPHATGTNWISVALHDDGGTDNGGVDTSAPQTVRIEVVGTNDPPVISIDSSNELSVREDEWLAFHGISVSDVDAGSGTLLLGLSVTNGTLYFNTTNTLTFVSGTNGITNNVTISGTLDQLNHALHRLNYRGFTNYNGPDRITIVVDDQGNTGTGGAQRATNAIDLTVLPVNDPPTFALSTNLVVADENFTNTLTVTVTPGTVPADETSQTVTYRLSPAVADFASTSINATNGTVSILSVSNAFGTQDFQVIADDGQSENNLAVQTFTLTINAVNQAPTVSFVTPTNGAVLAVSNNILLSVAAYDVDGYVTQVQFFSQATNLLGTSTNSPFFFVWTNAAVGTYSLTAVATDDLGATNVSTAISITVDTDTDGDGVPDSLESLFGTSASNWDTDGDGVSDWLEILQGRNPLIAGSVGDVSNRVNLIIYKPLKP